MIYENDEWVRRLPLQLVLWCLEGYGGCPVAFALSCALILRSTDRRLVQLPSPKIAGLAPP